MKFDLSLVKKHPVASGAAIIVGGLLLYLLLRGGGGDGGGAVASGPSEAELASQTQLALQQGQLSAAAAEQQFQLAALGTKYAGEYQLALLQAETGTVQQANALQVQQTLGLAELTTQQQLAQLQASTTTNLATIQANKEIQQQAITTQYGIQLAEFQNAANVAMAQINASTQVALSEGINRTQVQLADYNYKTAKAYAKGSGGGTLGTILGFASNIAGLFL